MPCESCGEREAVIHLTQIVNNTVTTMHLCEQCAAEKGVETGANVAKFPLGDFLATLGQSAAAAPGAAGAEVACAHCGGTLQDFRNTGRLGCAQCYQTFEPHLRDLLRRLHGSTRHEGEAYAPPDAAPRRVSAQLGNLRDQLRRAVDAENFELAAELRDRIRVLE